MTSRTSASLEQSLAATGASGSIALYGDFNFSISGTWVGAVDLQRSFDGGTTWRLVASYDANIEDRGLEPEANVLYRASFTRTSGTAVVRLGR